MRLSTFTLMLRLPWASMVGRKTATPVCTERPSLSRPMSVSTSLSCTFFTTPVERVVRWVINSMKRFGSAASIRSTRGPYAANACISLAIEFSPCCRELPMRLFTRSLSVLCFNDARGGQAGKAPRRELRWPCDLPCSPSAGNSEFKENELFCSVCLLADEPYWGSAFRSWFHAHPCPEDIRQKNLAYLRQGQRHNILLVTFGNLSIIVPRGP